MLSVLIAVEDEEEGLARTLASLVPAVAEGVLRDAVILDTGDRQAVAAIADAAGCRHLHGPLAETLPRAAADLHGPWIMMLAPGVVLEHDWFREVADFAERGEAGGQASRLCACFAYASARYGLAARLREAWRFLRSNLLGLPHPGQGLIIHRERLRGLASGRKPPTRLPPTPPSGLRLVLLRARAFAPDA